MKPRIAALVLVVTSPLIFAACGPQGEADVASAPEAANGTAAPASHAPPPPPPESPEATVQYVVEGMLAHEPQRVWAALPASYQSDIQRLISAFASNLDADVYDRGFALVARAGRVLEEKKELFLASEMLPDAIDRAEAAANWDSFTGMLRTLATSEISRVESLAALDVEAFLGNTGRTLLAQAERASAVVGDDLFEELRAVRFEVVESGEDEAVLRVSGGGFAGAGIGEELELVRVEGRWVPKEMADDWNEMMAEFFEGVEGFSKEEFEAIKPQILGVYNMLEGTMAQLEAAETVEQLDSALQVAMFSIIGMFMGAAMQGMEGMEPDFP